MAGVVPYCPQSNKALVLFIWPGTASAQIVLKINPLIKDYRIKSIIVIATV